MSKSELAEVTGKIPPPAIEAVWEGIKSNVFWKLQVYWQAAPLICASAAAPCLEDCEPRLIVEFYMSVLFLLYC